MEIVEVIRGKRKAPPHEITLTNLSFMCPPFYHVMYLWGIAYVEGG